MYFIGEAAEGLAKIAFGSVRSLVMRSEKRLCGFGFVSLTEYRRSSSVEIPRSRETGLCPSARSGAGVGLGLSPAACHHRRLAARRGSAWRSHDRGFLPDFANSRNSESADILHCTGRRSRRALEALPGDVRVRMEGRGPVLGVARLPAVLATHRLELSES
jgi:hypothetical protein